MSTQKLPTALGPGIKASSARSVEALLVDLGADEVVRREVAAARLIVLGPRAVGRLIGVLESDPRPAARTAALKTLEAIGDPRTLEPALQATADGDTGVAAAAVSVSGRFLRTARGARVVDHLTAIALDRAQADTIRSTAIRALQDLEPSTVAPLLAAVRDDPSAAVRAAADPAAPENQSKPREPVEELDDSAGDPGALRHVVASVAATAPLGALLGIVERARAREIAEPGHRSEWMAARGAAHMALASRGSRLAVYDLRELLGTAAALPLDFTAALAEVGDRSCLDPIATAYARAAGHHTGRSRERQATWRQQLADAFRAIVTRERLTRRHALMKKLEKRSKAVFEELWSGGRVGPLYGALREFCPRCERRIAVLGAHGAPARERHGA